VWGRNIRIIVVIPSILALAYLCLSIYLDLLPTVVPDLIVSPLGMWLAVNGTNFISEGIIQTTPSGWASNVAIISLATSMGVNALVTGLIVYRIFKVFRREVQFSTTSAEKFLGFTGGRRLRSLIFSIIESGMALFSIQLVRVICSLHQFLPINGVLCFIIVTHQLLNVIIY
jgi:hypothetical protein